uniref:PI-PLC Y-box domain-containing protein n=1 Tax=viral metagenome TaxID=1070528 RepID=A0A6C0IW04_9ZZZZ
MESGNIKTTLKNIYNKILGSSHFKTIQNSSTIDKITKTSNRVKNQIVEKKHIILVSFTILLLILIYLIFLFRRVPRYLSGMKKYDKFMNLRPLDSFTKLINSNYRLCDFYIASSYKSYLPCTNYYDYSSTSAIREALKYGARYIDLDVYNKTFDQCTTPLVCNGKEVGNWHYTSTITFDECCKVISETAFSNLVKCPTDPLFININLHVNENIITINKIASIVKHYFEHKLLPLKYSHQGTNPDFTKGINLATTPIQKFINKVIIICNDQFKNTHLDEIVNLSPKNVGNLRDLAFSNVKNSYDSEELIEYNKKHFTRVIIDKQNRNKKNFNYNIPWYFGCQFICMDYFRQDDYMISYIKKFSKSSFVLKPYKLRYHPTYIEPPKKQIPEVSFAPKKVTTPYYSITY